MLVRKVIVFNGAEVWTEYEILGAGQRFKGKKRSELKDSDFLYPADKAFPIVGPQSIPKALHDWGRSKREGDYNAFVHKLYNFVKNKNSSWLSAFPEETLKKAGIKK